MKLNNGVEIPQIGLGTFMLSPNDAFNSVKVALENGYKLIDTANAYVNEKAVGKAIKMSNIDRKDIFVSTKLWVTEYENEKAVDETLERLGLEYIDLLFIHQPAGNYLAGYKLLEKAYKEGKVRAIGLSNFEGKYLNEILSNCEIRPQVMQVEAHPYFVQEELRKTLDKYDIKLMSWYPLGHGDSNLLNENIFTTLAHKDQKTPSQIILRWHIDMGFIVIPGSKNALHIKENLDVLNFALSDDDMNEISKINKNQRYYIQTEENLKHYQEFKPKYEE